MNDYNNVSYWTLILPDFTPGALQTSYMISFNSLNTFDSGGCVCVCNYLHFTDDEETEAQRGWETYLR